MADVDDTALDERLKDLAQAVARAGHTPPYGALVARARTRRRIHATTGVGLALVVVLAAGAALRPGTNGAAPTPADTPAPTVTNLAELPLAVDGQVTDVVQTPAGGLALLYGECPPKAEVCAPHLYVARDGGKTWGDRYDFDGRADRARLGVSPPKRFDVSAAGDVALLDEQAGDPERPSTGHRIEGVLIDADDPGIIRGIITASREPLRDADLTEASHGIPVPSQSGFDVIQAGVRRPLTTSAMAQLGTETFVFANTTDGILTAKIDNTHSVASRDLGVTWVPVPDLPAASLTRAVMAQGATGLVRFGWGDWLDTYEVYPLSRVQVSTDSGVSWTTRRVTITGGSDVPLNLAAPVGDGTFVAVDAQGTLYRSYDGSTFQRDPAMEGRTVAQLGGHLGQVWVVTKDGELFMRSPAANGAWQLVSQPE